jgi:indole-3-glycerol phosphate synthase
VSSTPSFLDDIYAAKRAELRRRREEVSQDAIEAAARRAPGVRSFIDALRTRRPAIIAEIKRASPSKGDILPGLDPVAVARDYKAAGAAAISVLTDAHFKGSLDDLRAVRAATDLPILRKDFIFDAYQVFEARAAGADCILLIAAMLEEGQTRSLAAIAAQLGMAALIEVHNIDELRIAERAGASILGINNRDLHTFKTDLAVSELILAQYRGDALVVSESGINTPDDIRRLHRAGARAFLIGESILRGGKPRVRLAELMSALNGEPARA